MQCFDTLTESIQGPCKLNQTAIGNSKFLEYAVQVLSEDDKIFELKKTNKNSKDKDRGQLADSQLLYAFTLHPGKLARLKFKCLNTIVSLLECNETQDSLILRIIRAIPLLVLTNNLSRIFTLFQKYQGEEYNMDVFNRADSKIDTTKEDDYSEFIIENGFSIYFLMQLFLNNKKAKDLLYEDSEMSDVLNEFNE